MLQERAHYLKYADEVHAVQPPVLHNCHAQWRKKTTNLCTDTCTIIRKLMSTLQPLRVPLKLNVPRDD